MALIVKDRVKETTTTTGTGTVTLAGAAVGFQSFAIIGNANTTYYAIVDSATGAWEVGIGTYTSSGTLLSRDTVLESSTGGAKISFGAGAKEVFVTYPADRSVSQADVGTAPNQLPLNQYLGNLAYQDAANIAGNVGVGGDLTVTGTSTLTGAITTTGVLTLPAGTVSAPALTTTGDTNTGMFFPAADTIAFTEGGVEAMRITSAGNVGIGTSSPSAKLSVGGSDAPKLNLLVASGAERAFIDYTEATSIMRIDSDGDISLRTNNAESIRINAFNNVGIGTASPDANLTVNGAASFAAGTALLPSIARASDLNTGFWFPAADTIAASTAGTERMRIGSTGTISLGAAPGSESLRVTPVASAVNYVEALGALTAQPPTLRASGSDTNIPLWVSSKGTSGLNFYTNTFSTLQFTITHVASAVNYLQVTGNATGNAPTISAQGSDTNIPLAITSKGSSPIDFYTSAFASTQFRIAHTASAVNYLQVTGSATGGPSLLSQGSDTNINMFLITKGTGSINFYTNSGTLQFVVAHTASAFNTLQVTGAATGVAPVMSAVGSDTNIDLALTPKGTGVLKFGTYTAGILAQAGYITIKDAAGNTRNLLVG